MLLSSTLVPSRIGWGQLEVEWGVGGVGWGGAGRGRVESGGVGWGGVGWGGVGRSDEPTADLQSP